MSIRYFLTTKTHCQVCSGTGKVSFINKAKPKDKAVVVDCTTCTGKGFIAGEQEVELAKFGGTTGFAKVANMSDEDTGR